MPFRIVELLGDSGACELKDEGGMVSMPRFFVFRSVPLLFNLAGSNCEKSRSAVKARTIFLEQEKNQHVSFIMMFANNISF